MKSGDRARGAPGERGGFIPAIDLATEAFSQAGERPVFVDIDPLTFNLDPALLQRALTPRTRAIVPVHLYGQTADMDPILVLAECGERLVGHEYDCHVMGRRYADLYERARRRRPAKVCAYQCR